MSADARTRLYGALQRLIARLDRQVARLEQMSRRFSWARLGVVLGGLAAAFPFYQAGADRVGGLVLLLFAVAFIVLARRHNQIERALRRHRRYRGIKAAHAARMRLDWEALPPHAGSPPADHPFALDLNLTGPRSLHHLLDTAASHGGSERLRAWLTATEPSGAAARQAVVRELAPRTPFRDRLALVGSLIGTDPHHRWDGELLLRWLDRPAPLGRIRRLLLALGALALVNILLFVANLAFGLPAWWVFSFTLYAWIYLLNRRLFAHLFEDAEHLYTALLRFRAVLTQLEGASYARCPRLAEACAPFRKPDRAPSSYLRRITWLAAAAGSQKSEVLTFLLNALAPWDLFFTDRLERYKAALRETLPDWLDAWYDVEALCSLANFAYLNPEAVYPDLLPAGAEPAFEGEGLGHPLLPADRKVRNDFCLGGPGEITILTGSNMSGKSTFLRTLGVNLRLAYAGAPVDAHRLRTIPWRLFTCIQVSDSVNDGISYFYAEVRRLKALLIALRAPSDLPLFFLIDEIFRGTNNRERLLGSRAYLRALAGGHGAGLVATHDLELVQLADELPDVRNMHFREDVIDGRMVFDYRLRTGPCPTTNALKIMRLEGLPVE